MATSGRIWARLRPQSVVKTDRDRLISQNGIGMPLIISASL
jgi:hypothetical protein